MSTGLRFHIVESWTTSPEVTWRVSGWRENGGSHYGGFGSIAGQPAQGGRAVRRWLRDCAGVARGVSGDRGSVSGDKRSSLFLLFGDELLCRLEDEHGRAHIRESCST